MILKICSKCGIGKPLNEFYLRKTGERAGKVYEKCKECMKSRGRSYYSLNHDRQLKLALIRRAKARLINKNYLKSIKDKPCVDCGIKYDYYVMDFDHLNEQDKENNVARMAAGGWSLKKLIKEINKCEVVCANCHRIRTYKNKLR